MSAGARPGRAALLAAGVAASALVFAGCLDGTVRTAPGAGKTTGQQGAGGQQGNGEQGDGEGGPELRAPTPTT